MRQPDPLLLYSSNKLNIFCRLSLIWWPISSALSRILMGTRKYAWWVRIDPSSVSFSIWIFTNMLHFTERCILKLLRNIRLIWPRAPRKQSIRSVLSPAGGRNVWDSTILSIAWRLVAEKGDLFFIGRPRRSWRNNVFMLFLNMSKIRKFPIKNFGTMVTLKSCFMGFLMILQMLRGRKYLVTNFTLMHGWIHRASITNY